MLDIEEQLAQLRKRVASVNLRYQTPPAASPPPPRPVRSLVEELSEGREVENEHGRHFQMERLYESHRRHGSADIGALSELPADLLDALGAGAIPACPPERWAFLDTETTGLAGGSGTYAFLVGVGRITPQGFHIRQFFLRDYGEERSLLAALTDHLNAFDVLITYNGKAYDQPLLETRYRMSRQKPPFARMTHLDLLHGARTLWKLRLENCRLTQLEQQILGVEREGDVPGALIPHMYFEYLRTRAARRLLPVFYHNAIDILTLGCLTAIVPAAFRATDTDSLRRLGLRRGEELAGLARWLLAAEQEERGLELLKRALAMGLPEPLTFRAIWDIALLEKRLGRPAGAINGFTELSTCQNPYRVAALEEIAKYYEHTERNDALALEFTMQALACERTEELMRRRLRLEKRLAKPRARRLV